MNELSRHDRIFKFIAVLMVTTFFVATTGCGGGGSSSGGGGASAGTYSGSGSVNLSIPGFGIGVVTFTFTVTIGQNGAVEYMDSAGAFLQGTLSGNTFSMSPRASNLFEEASCTGTVTFVATINGVNLVGTIEGNNVVCFGVSNGVTGRFNGTLSGPTPSRMTPSGFQWNEALRN